MTPTDRDALLERLEVGEWSGKAYGKLIERGTTIWPRNPEGAEAAALIRQQAETIARLRSLVETAFEAGFACGSNVTGWTAAEAWENSRARATLDETGV